MDSTLKIWNWRTGEVLRTLTGHSDAVTCLVAEKNTIVSGSADSTIRVWDFDRGVVVCLRGHSEWINDVKLWSPPTAEDLSKPTKTLKPFLSKGFKKTLDPDIPPEQLPVRLLFSAGDDGHIRVWDLRTNNCVRVLESHVAQVQSLSIGTVFTAHHSDKDGNVSQDESNPMLADRPADGAPASPNGANVIGYFEDRAADCHSSNSQRFPCLRIDEPPQCQVGPAGQRPGMPPIPTSNTPALPPLELGDAKPIIFSVSAFSRIQRYRWLNSSISIGFP